ncbi:hypothetical protein, partial [Staphylococcus aureus]|uniref:hypothetical protein n=1 Tax=Staphylococcus aureus TaxID=1280 RepID=UPI00193ACBF7
SLSSICVFLQAEVGTRDERVSLWVGDVYNSQVRYYAMWYPIIVKHFECLTLLLVIAIYRL